MYIQQEPAPFKCITSSRNSHAGKLATTLKLCRDLETVMKVHKQAAEAELHTNKYVASAMINMYSRFRNMSLAHQLFSELVQPDVVLWNALILGYVNNGESSTALDVFTAMECVPDCVTYVAALKACGNLGAGSEKELYLLKGMSIHKEVKRRGFDSKVRVANSLIVMYGKCGRMQLAREIFDGMDTRDTVTWTSLILGYVKNCECLVAMDVFYTMDCAPDSFAYAALLQACIGMVSEIGFEKDFCLEKGVGIHKRIQQLPSSHSDVVVGNSLIVMYSKLSSMNSAKEVFNSISHRDVVTWNSLLFGYVENKKSSIALDLFSLIDCEPTSLTYVAVIKACAGLVEVENLEKPFCVEKGICIHKQLKHYGFESEIIVATTLLDMYRKCGHMILAREVFNGMACRTVVTRSSLMLGYVENGECLAALELFDNMDCQPSTVTFVAVLKACGALASGKESDKHLALEKGMKLHKEIAESGVESELTVATTLLDMYSRCGRMELAKGVFDRLKHRDVVAWNSLMLGYVENTQGSVALELFSDMDCKPSIVSYVVVLKAYGASGEVVHLNNVISLHKQIKAVGFDSDIRLANTLIDTYSKCRSMNHAKTVFDAMAHRDVISWTSLIMGYVGNNQSRLAVELFMSMDCKPSSVTYISVLMAYAALAGEGISEKGFFLGKGVSIHKQVIDRRFDRDIVLANTLIDMYSHCGGLQHAKAVFDGMPIKDVVTYNALVHGYVLNGESLAAVELYTSMDAAQPNAVTYVVILKACGSLDTLLAGQKVHGKVCELGLEQDHIVANALSCFYVKRGNMNKAEILFHQMHSPDTVSWNILIAGYSSLGQPSELFARARKMAEAGVPMDGVTFTCIMTACSHSGLIEKAGQFFDCVVEGGMRLSVEHYNCIVDMLGRADRVEEAVSFIGNMPFEANSTTWTSLLAACRKWNNMEVGKLAFSSLVSSKVVL